MDDARRWLHGLWTFYLAYTDRPIHAASAALLAIFGILVFVDPLFSILAVAAYVAPPVILYVLADDPGTRAGRYRSIPDRNSPVAPERDVRRETVSSTGRGGVVGDAGSDSDGTDTDTDSDSDGADTDTDSDSDGTDTDTDSDG